MEHFLENYIEAVGYFDKSLPYWCDNFLRPADEEFATYLHSKGHNVTYCVLEVFEQVYIPKACDHKRVLETAVVRRELREKGVEDEDLPILL
ncbi:TPA: hypothetical protein NGU23_004611 [Vibrio parahaemolyticus]|nr:hypothetical protein [Vibrio parahaemolyticus]